MVDSEKDTEAQEAAKPKKKNAREEELIKAVFSTAQGRELLNIWRDYMIYHNAFPAGLSESECRTMAGTQNVYRRFIKLSERK